VQHAVAGGQRLPWTIAQGTTVLTDRLDSSDRSQQATDEFENQLWVLGMAGNSTVRNSLPGALWVLLNHRDAWVSLRRDRSLLPA
jgi:cytochrome P450